jgi:arylsulfatase A-like enzyme
MKTPARLCPVALLLALAACGGGSSGSPAGSTPAAALSPAATPFAPVDLGPPNVVLILADDLGWGDLGSFGHTAIKTPNIDRIGAEGARFTSFYVPAAVCAPSRAGLMTGRFPARTGIAWNPPDHLNPDETTVAELLQARGYATGMVGKWHLGWDAPHMPVHYGFDFYYGIPAGEDTNYFYSGDSPTKDEVGPDQLSRKYTQEALRFAGSVARPRPFFLYLAHRDPHLPNYPAADFTGRSAGGSYGDTIEQLDATVGDLMKGLKDLGVDQNTLVIFTSDNGPVVPPKGPGSAGNLSGSKGSVEEGGVRVPALMRWPARIRPGRVVAEPVSTLDLLPTLVALAGASLPRLPLDGQDVSRLLTGQVERIGGRGIDGGRELVFFGPEGAAAIRSGRFKYMRPGFWNTQPSLYDLDADPGERNDLRASRPDLVKQLDARIADVIAGR